MEAATILSFFQNVIYAANISMSEYPPSYAAQDGQSFDVIIVGCGTAGSVLANRLSEISGLSVLAVERGGDPPVTTQMPGYFPFLPNTIVDYNYTSENDGVTSQGLNDHRVALTRGKVLGGSSSIDHTVYERGTEYDYNAWALSESSKWNYDTILEYFKKSEKNIDPRIMNGPTAKYHNANGIRTVNKQTTPTNYNTTEATMLKVTEELGIPNVWDVNIPTVNGSALISVTATADGVRASAAHEYILPIANRSNFYLMKNSQVTKIIIENDTAVGIVVKTESGEITLYADKEVIVSAGTFNSPQLLMLSGVGPKEHLEALNITVVKDLPVGRTLKDHITVIMTFCGNTSTVSTMEEIAAAADLTTMPVPITGATYGFDDQFADFQHITLYFTPQSPLYYYFLNVDFNYNKNITDSLMEQCGDRELFTTLSVLTKPYSSGNATLRSADPSDSLKIYTGYYSDERDVDRMVKNLKLFYQLQNTSYFQEVGGYFARPTLPACDDFDFPSDEYWECYALNLGTTTMHPSCTNAMGQIVDEELKVIGLNKLRVCDDSVMPDVPAAKTCATTIAIAEMLADMIIEEYGYTVAE